MKEIKTIATVVESNLCHGCGTCISLCPLDAIALTRDNHRGIYLPKIDFSNCNECSICLKVCPGHEVDFDQLNAQVFSQNPEDTMLGVYINCSTGYAADRKVRYDGASSGIVTAVLLYALEKGIIDGALVTRMNPDSPLEPEPFIARTREEIISAAKSKYCPVPANIALREILEKEGKYAVVGLPCHFHGIRKAEKINKLLTDRIVLNLGIFCGYTYSFLATDFLLSKYGIRKEDVRGIDYRGEGWPGGMSIYLANDRKIFIPSFESYKLLDTTFNPWRCLLCCDGAAELADISFGDAWLPEFADDKMGRSVIISRTSRGEAVLKQMAESGFIELEDISAAGLLTSQPTFIAKKVNIHVFLWLAGLLRQGIPDYTTRLSKTGFSDSIKASLQSMGPFLAPKRYLWRFLPLLHKLRPNSLSIPKM